MRPIHRRAVLKGMLGGGAIGVGLPLLELMLSPSGRAMADGGELPTRFGVWFWGNGVKPDRWIPGNTGSNWSPSEELAPLADLVPYVSVLSGLEVKTATHPHHSGMSAMLVGAPYYQLGTVRDTIVSTFAYPSVDQDAADWFGGLTPFRSIEIGVTRFRGSDEGTTFEHLSHNGPNLPNPSEYDPGALYRRLFGVSSDARVDLVRQSVLDVVGDQITRLQGRLGATDKQRLDQHLDSIRQLEQRLGSDMGACEIPASEPAAYADVNGQEQIEPQNIVMSQLCALALACDLTRSFSVQYSTCGSGVINWEVGATDGAHSQTHFEASPQPIVNASVTFNMAMLAQFLRTLRDTPEGEGNVLDRCSILCTSELSEGITHSNVDIPVLIAGLGGGRLKGGYHYRSGSKENTSKAALTALRGAGCDFGSYGHDGGYVTDPISSVLR